MKTKASLFLFAVLVAALTLGGCAGPEVRHDARVDRRYDRVTDRHDDRYERRYDRVEDRYY